MVNNDTLRESFKKELEEATINTILDPAYRKRKLVLWTIRATISVLLYIVFWKHDWVKWTLLLTIPLSLFSLFTIIGSPFLLKRKIERTKKIIEETERQITVTPDE